MKILLDTHVLLWWFEETERLSEVQRGILNGVASTSSLLISDITLWEIATLHELGRIRLRIPLRDWLERATAPPLVRRLGISPSVAAEVAQLPTDFHRDPADRILVATARVHGASLMTRDQRIIAADIVPVIA